MQSVRRFCFRMLLKWRIPKFLDIKKATFGNLLIGNYNKEMHMLEVICPKF